MNVVFLAYDLLSYLQLHIHVFPADSHVNVCAIVPKHQPLIDFTNNHVQLFYVGEKSKANFTPIYANLHFLVLLTLIVREQITPNHKVG